MLTPKISFGILIFIAVDFVTSQTCLNYYGRSGVCMPLQSCPSLSRLDKFSFYNRAILDGSYCSGTDEQYCCADGIIATPTTEKTTTTSTHRQTIVTRTEQSNAATNLLPNPENGECGLQNTDKIFGGNQTEIDEFPWMALLEYTWSGGQKAFRCGGVMISDRFVLTAAHCIKTGSPRLSGVRLGEWNYETETDCKITGITRNCADEPPQNFRIEKTFTHPGYSNKNDGSPNDIALLRLSSPARITKYVRPICLPISETLHQITDYHGSSFIVAGWGRTEDNVLSSIKLKVDVNGVSIRDCKRIFPKVWENHICAGGVEGKDSCGGDSGGPLMAVHSDTPGNNYWYVAGVVSFGATDCGKAGVPGVYTRIDRYLDWIQDKVMQSESRSANILI